jgi:parallel beta-helix repeat protein
MQSAVFATEQVDQSNLPEWGGGWTHINPDPNGQARMWQTFTPNYSNITAVEIDILTVNIPQLDDIITVEIAKDGEILASTERNVEYGYEGLLRFDFAEAVAVVPGELYELKVHDTGLTRFGWRYASNTYDAGTRYVSAIERSGTDWFFQTYSLEPHIIYVDDDAVGANDGASWEDAYVYLQDALVDANSTEKPVEIRVAQGIYKPHQSQLPIAEFFWRSMSFELINGVVLKGGYSGVIESDPNTRDIGLYKTILSGDLYGDDVEVADPCDLLYEPTRAENSFHVVMASNINKTAILDGLTITGGNADGPETFNFCFGGGMYNQNSSPILINCTFNGNTSTSYGGGVFNSSNCSPILINCIFNGNASKYGGIGGMCNFFESSPTLTNCTFSRNFGSGMVNFSNSSPTLTNCTFSRNFGSGMVNFSNSSPTLTNCTFSENSAELGGGGGMNNWGKSSPILTNCTFRGNIAWSGGGMENNMDSSPILTNCIFRSNVAKSGGGMDNYENSSPILTNCTFNQNSAENYGGGMDNLIDSNPILTNCIFSNNTAGDDGGGICNFASSPVLINCTFAQNSAENGNAIGSGIVYDYYRIDPNNMRLINCILWDGGNEIWNEYGSPTIITYCNIQGGKASIFDPSETVFWGKGNIDVDPLFVNLGYWADADYPNVAVEPNDPNAVWIDGDYHLKSEAGRWDRISESWILDDVTSPCVDTGDPNIPVGDEPEPNGGRINIGAYGGTAEASKSDMSELFQMTKELSRASRFKAVK